MSSASFHSEENFSTVSQPQDNFLFYTEGVVLTSVATFGLASGVEGVPLAVLFVNRAP